MLTTVSRGRIQGLSAALVSSHLAGSGNKHLYSPLDGFWLFTWRGPEFCSCSLYNGHCLKYKGRFIRIVTYISNYWLCGHVIRVSSHHTHPCFCVEDFILWLTWLPMLLTTRIELLALWITAITRLNFRCGALQCDRKHGIQFTTQLVHKRYLLLCT